MAIVSLNLAYKGEKALPTSNSGTQQSITTDYNNKTKAADFGLYRTDEVTRAEFPFAVGVPNPVYQTLETSDGFDAQSLQDHAYPYINKFKVCEIMYGTAGSDKPFSPDDESWGNWRKNNPGGIPVFDNVFLFPDDKVFQFSYTNTYDSAWEAVDPGGIGSKISQIAEAARSFQALAGGGVDSKNVAGKLMSRFKKAPAWTGTDPIKLGSNLKFTFQFGQAGIFSGEHEVVRPILALASLWVPIKTDSSYYRGILPTPPYFLMTALKQFAGGIGNLAGFEGNTGGGVIGAMTSAEQKLISIQEKAIANALSESGSRAIYIRMGRMVLGPYIVKDVNWDFDFTHTDEYGFPFKGSLTFGGLESCIMPDPNQITQVWNGGTGTENKNFTDEKTKALYAEQQDDASDAAGVVTPATNPSGQSSPPALRKESENFANTLMGKK